MARKSTKPALVIDHSSNPSATAVSDRDIAALAYQLWLQRGRPEGSSQEDWFEAERKLLQTESRATYA